MNKVCLIGLVTVIAAISCHSPTIVGQKTLGGDNEDILTSICVTKDGGYIIAGWSYTDSSGEKIIKNHGVIYSDFWIIKFNKDNQLLWQKCLGGLQGEFSGLILSTNDGGCLINGNTTSDISGDKTESSRGSADIWIVKLDSLGNIQWDKTIGASNSDVCGVASIAEDGGYFIGGATNSGLSGDKTDTCRGDADMWIIKLNNKGKIEWQKTLGGNKWEFTGGLQSTSDGGVLVCGNSASDISGEKSESNRGKRADFWVLKLDKNGNKMWDKTIGGDNDDMALAIKKTNDGNFLMVGFSSSNKSGEKSDNSKGGTDIWVVEIDSSGKKIWDKTIGGNDEDYPALDGILLTLDGGYILCGKSISGISGDKTEPCKGDYDYWIIKFSKTGKKEWDKTIGGSSYENLVGVVEIARNHFVLAGQSDSGVSGDKTDSSRGIGDYWIVYLND